MILLVLALVRIGRFADAAVDRELKEGSKVSLAMILRVLGRFADAAVDTELKKGL